MTRACCLGPAARLGRHSSGVVLLLLLLAHHACLVTSQAWRVLPAGYGAAASPPPGPSPRRAGGMLRGGAGSSEEGAAMPVAAQAAVSSGTSGEGGFTAAALPLRPTPVAVLPAAAAVAAVTQPRPRGTPAVVTPPVLSNSATSSDEVYAPYATLPPQTTTVREANGDTVSTTKTVTEEVPLSRLTAGLFQDAAAAKGVSRAPQVPSTTTEATSDVPRGGVERIIERVPVPVPVPVPVKAPAAVAAKTAPAKKAPPPVVVASSPPPPPQPVTAELTNVPTPLDLVQAHQAAMQAVGGDRFIMNRTALEEALSGTAAAPTPATSAPHSSSSSSSSKAPARASGHTPAKAALPSKAAAPQVKVARHHGFAYWAGLWFLLLLMCLCVSLLARGARGAPVFAPNMLGQASQAAEDGLKWVTQTAGAYGSTSSSQAPVRSAAPVRASSERRGEGKSHGHHSKGKNHHHKGDKRRGGAKEDDLAPEEYMMTSLRSDRSVTTSAPSDAGGGGESRPAVGGHRSAPSLSAAGGAPAPPWEQLYRDAPTVATTRAVDVLQALGKGKKATSVARSWVPDDVASRQQLKCLVQTDKEGVFVAWQESRLGPRQRVQVHSVLAALDTLTVSLDTASGDMQVHPADVEGRALWVLGLNAAFHAHSAALAVATRGDWDVSSKELEAAVIGLPWHPAVYLAASQAAMATAGVASALPVPSGAGTGRHRGHPVAPPPPGLHDDGRMLDAL
jgi:hypothetical protein